MKQIFLHQEFSYLQTQSSFYALLFIFTGGSQEWYVVPYGAIAEHVMVISEQQSDHRTKLREKNTEMYSMI